MSVEGILAFGYAFEPESSHIDEVIKNLAEELDYEPDIDGYYDLSFMELMDEVNVGVVEYGHSEYPGYIITPLIKGDTAWDNRFIITTDFWHFKPVIFSTMPTISVEELQPFLRLLRDVGVKEPSSKLMWHLTAYVSI